MEELMPDGAANFLLLSAMRVPKQPNAESGIAGRHDLAVEPISSYYLLRRFSFLLLFLNDETNKFLVAFSCWMGCAHDGMA